MFSEKDLTQEKTEICNIHSLGFAVWVEDASLLYSEICKIKQKHPEGLSRYLEINPQELPRLIDLIKVIDVNEETVKLYKAQHKNELLRGIRKFFIKETFYDFAKMICALSSGAHEFTYTSSKITNYGIKKITQVHVKIPENAINDWSSMIVSEHEISDFIKREIALKIELEKVQSEIENKDKILSIIAHDLKNPFNTILGFSELLLHKFSTFEEDQKVEFISYINESANHSYQLLTNLLHWNKMQKTTTLKNLQVFNLKPLVNSVVDLIHTNCIAKAISINSNVPDNIMVYADYNMMSFILRNVLTNAIKFSYKNSEIILSASISSTHTVITVIDKGIGMDADTQLSLFDPEKLVSNKGTENECGTGIGLMLTKEFVEKQNGTLEIESEIDSGTQIIITIPSQKSTYF